MLQHQKPESGEQAPNQAGALPAGAAGAPQLTSDELSDLLSTAIARQEGEARYGDVATLDDALEIARQLNIPEQHVVAAAEELRARKVQEAEHRLTLEQRTLRKRAIKAGRGRAFTTGTVLAAVAGVAASFFTGVFAWLALPVVAAAYLAARWLFIPVSDEEADRTELPPAAGQCRVCGRPAHTPQATFCEEHRFKPGE